MDFSRPHLLRDEAEYELAVAEIEELLDSDPAEGSEAYERLEFLSVLVEAWEDAHVDIPEASPREAVAFMLEQNGLDRSWLADVMGGRSRVSEFFSGKRELSKSQIEALHDALGIPAGVLLGISSREG